MSNTPERSPNNMLYAVKSKMKTYIGKKGYTISLKDFSEEQIFKIKEDLTFKPFRPQGYGPDTEPFSIYGLSKNKMFIPKFYGIEKFGKPDEIKLSQEIKINLEFNGKLRENQIEPINACLKAAEDTGGGILCLACGAGKTSLALYLIAKLGLKALVIVNKEFLMDQWKERIKQFLPEARIGILRQKKIKTEDKDIVIAMLQSVAMCDYDASTYDGFGISFYDEVHCVPSKIFSKALRKINTKYHFGLSATPNRADGMSTVTKLYIGPIVYQIDKKKSKKNPKKLQVFTVAFDKLPSGNLYRSLYNYQGKPDVVRMISNITKCPKRLALISTILRFFIIKDKRHILVLSDRIQYLRDIEEKINKDLGEDVLLGEKSHDLYQQAKPFDVPFKIRYYIGGMKEKERKDSESADLLLASYSMAKEAMDIPILDTVLMVTSKSNIEQSIGRIQRKIEYPDEKPPLVIDLVDNFSSFQSQSMKRDGFYRKNHYPVTKFIFDDNNSSKIYSDFEEGVKGFLQYSENSDNSETEECKDKKESSSKNKSTKKKPIIIQTKIDSSLYNMIGDGNFDV
jgi:superfamily II DNA or RNA helicase